jgi:hypothetical protein
MKGMKEKFTIKTTETGMTILDSRGNRLDFTAGEALMLLDILRNEEAYLKEIFEKASPIPIRIKI